MSPEIKVFRPIEEVRKELREIAKKYWEAEPGSLKSIVDDFSSSLHFVSKGRFGKASLSSRLASTFEEAMDITIAEAAIALATLQEKLNSQE